MTSERGKRKLSVFSKNNVLTTRDKTFVTCNHLKRRKLPTERAKKGEGEVARGAFIFHGKLGKRQTATATAFLRVLLVVLRSSSSHKRTLLCRPLSSLSNLILAPLCQP